MSDEQWLICLSTSMQKYPVLDHSHHTTGTLHPADSWTPSCTSCSVWSSGINFWGTTLTVGKHSRKNFNFEAILRFWLNSTCGGYVIHCDDCTELNAKLFQPCWDFWETPGSNSGTVNAPEFMVWNVCAGTANGFRHRPSASCKGIISAVKNIKLSHFYVLWAVEHWGGRECWMWWHVRTLNMSESKSYNWNTNKVYHHTQHFNFNVHHSRRVYMCKRGRKLSKSKHNCLYLVFLLLGWRHVSAIVLGHLQVTIYIYIYIYIYIRRRTIQCES